MINTLSADKTIRLFTRYLRMAGMTVSYFHIRKLLDTPVGLSMRGFSDALDAMRADHRVYQLPSSCLEELDIPFLTQLHSGEEYVIVEKIAPDTITYRSQRGLRVVDTDRFRTEWTGRVLVAQFSEETFREQYTWWKDKLYSLSACRLWLVVCICWIFLLLVTRPFQGAAFLLHLFLSGAGSVLALQAILQEQGDPDTSSRFCRIGSRINCRRVLRSGVKLAGTSFSLGEVAWWGFTVLLVFSCSFPQEYLWMSIVLLGIACCFTIYSLFYQAFVVRSWCLICMGINLVVWIDLGWLLIQPKEPVLFSLSVLLSLAGIAGCLFLLGITMRNLSFRLRNTRRLQQRLSALLDPSLFSQLLSQQPRKELPAPDCTLCSPVIEGHDNSLLILLSPRCRYCAEISKELRRLSGQFSLQLVFLTSSTDETGKEWVQKVISLYLSQGWDVALTHIEKWYSTPDYTDSLALPAEAALRMWTAQQEYGRYIRPEHTPTILLNGYELPDCYEVRDLYYVT
ncbi:MAG: hypothetical protein LIP08_16065 [Bacteroides sp.]|nr:hypothetical protein [Bacteroides sp.]